MWKDYANWRRNLWVEASQFWEEVGQHLATQLFLFVLLAKFLEALLDHEHLAAAPAVNQLVDVDLSVVDWDDIWAY